MAHATLSLKQRLWNPEARLAYVLIAPTAVFLVAFMFYPIVYVFVMSFFRTNKLSDLTRFVGTHHFSHFIFSEARSFRQVFQRYRWRWYVSDCPVTIRFHWSR